MKLHAIVSKHFRRNRNQNVGRTAAAVHTSARAVIEPLEERRLMADINWVNRGTTDKFGDVFGDKADAARQIVEAAIMDWSFAIQNFNYADTSHPNSYQLYIFAEDIGNAPYGGTGTLITDAQGKPYQTSIYIDDSHAFHIPEKWMPSDAFPTKSGDYEGKYAVGLPKPDLYTTVLHEIGHAMGIAVDQEELRIQQFLTPHPTDANLLNFNSGTTTATFTKTNGGHITSATELMNVNQPDYTRRMITPLDVSILRDGYGYTVAPAAQLPKIGELPVYWTQMCAYYDLDLPPGYGCTVQPSTFPPQLNALSNVTANEGDTITFQATALDANAGSTFTFGLVNPPAGATIHSQTGEFSFTPTDGPGTYNITVKVGDGGGCGCGGPTDATLYDTETMTITVGNVAPTPGVAAPAVAVRGQHVPFTLTATDPSSVDAATGFTYLVDWGDGTAPQTYDPSANNGAGKVVNHAFAADGTYTVKVTATDKDGGTSTEVTKQISIAQSAVLPDPGDPTKNAFFLGATIGDDTIRVTSKGITVNGTPTAIPAEVGRVIFFGQDGDDVIDMNGSLELPVILDGGAGNDSLSGGAADDVLLGSAGDDTLKGHLGRDLLIGGLGEDDLNGQHDDDILIGGATTHDNDLTALSALMAEWTRTDLPAVQRIAHLQAGGTDALNGTTLLDPASLIDDAVVDDLIGGPGENWLL